MISRPERFLILIFLIIGIAGISFSYYKKSSSHVEAIDFEEPRILININAATIEELEQLPGIGPVLARNIISHRQKIGGFENLEVLKNVKGIGNKKFEKMKDLIVIE